MKIVFIFDSLAESETHRYLLEEIFFLRAQDIDARVVTLAEEDPKNTLWSETLFTKENFTAVPIPKLWKFPDWKKLRLHLEYEMPDLVITYGAKADLCGRVVAKLAKVPIKLFVFAHDLADIRKRTKFYDDILSHVTDRYIVTTEEAKIALSKLEVSPKKIAVLRDGIDLGKYGIPPTHEIRSSLGISNDEFVFTFIGELLPEKNVPVILRALVKLQRGRLVIVGDGPEMKSLALLAEGLELKDRVVIKDKYFDIPGLLAVSDAMILTSKAEPEFPIILVLGLASGLPVIATDFPGVEKVIQKDVNGLIVRQQDSFELARVMEELMSNAQLYETLKKNTRNDLAQYSLATHAAKLLALAQERPGK